MVNVLPTIKLNGVDYTVDFRLRELRRTDQPHNNISFDTLKDEGDFYTIKFLPNTDNQLPDDGKLYPFGSLLACHIPAFVIDHPAQQANDENNELFAHDYNIQSD